jgi:hypothetical protein
MARVVALADAVVASSVEAAAGAPEDAAALAAADFRLGAAAVTVGRSASWVPVPERSPAGPDPPERDTWSG